MTGVIGCIVLAAGSSARFGSDKRVASLGNATLLERTLASLLPVFERRVLVLRPGDADLARRSAPDWTAVFAADAASGMGHSLAAAMTATAGWDGAVVALADMPFVSAATLRAVKERVTRDALVVPFQRGQRGNPVGIGGSYFAELAQLQGDQGARALLQKYGSAVVRLDVDDPGILRDIDTPAALAAQQETQERSDD